MGEGETGVKKAETWEGAALVQVEEAPGPGDGEYPHRHDSCENF